jgi:hypothetical protein
MIPRRESLSATAAPTVGEVVVVVAVFVMP